MKVKLVFKKQEKTISVEKHTLMPTLLEYMSSGEYKEDLMEDESKFVGEAGYYLTGISDEDEPEDVLPY